MKSYNIVFPFLMTMVTIMISNFGKQFATRNSTLGKVFSSTLLYCSVKSAQVLSAQKEIRFFWDMLF